MRWQQRNNKLIVTSPEGEFYFIMPDDWRLDNTHPDLLKFAEIVLFAPFYPELYDYKLNRPKGKNIGLSFSGGMDSTASLLLIDNLPCEIIPGYLQREVSHKTQLNQYNALNFISKLNKKTYIVKSNQELIRTHHGLQIGYSCDWAVVVHLILLADYLDLGYISSGTVLESTYLYKDIKLNQVKYRDFIKSDDWLLWSPLFKNCGIELLFPVGGLSEVLTAKMVAQSQYKDLAKSCLRAIGDCNNCYKCFRKNMLLNKPSPMNNELYKYVNNKPIRTLTTLLYATKQAGYILPELAEYMDLDVSFLNRYYSKALEILPIEFKNQIKTNIEKYYQPMNDKDIKILKGWCV